MRWISHLKILLFVFISLSFFNDSEAQTGGGGKFSGGLIVALGQGKMGNGTDVPNRTMTYTPVSLFAGYNIKKFRIGGHYEYNIAAQSEDPASVINQNLSGKGSALGIRLDYYDGKQSAGLIYRLSDTFNLNKPTSSGANAVYKSKGGFQIQYYRQIQKRFGFVVDYTTETFDDSLASSVKWDRIALGLVITNFNSSVR